MWTDELDIHGHPPSFESVRCDELLCQQYWYQGELCEPANVVYLRAGPTWHRLVLHYGIVFWSSQEDEPQSGGIPEIGAEYRLDDIGTRLDLAGRVVESYEASAVAGGVQVCFRFEGGRKITFQNIGHTTTIAT
jgi:hypothetical protein